jgi:hypothetical protein
MELTTRRIRPARDGIAAFLLAISYERGRLPVGHPTLAMVSKWIGLPSLGNRRIRHPQIIGPGNPTTRLGKACLGSPGRCPADRHIGDTGFVSALNREAAIILPVATNYPPHYWTDSYQHRQKRRDAPLQPLRQPGSPRWTYRSSASRRRERLK